MCPFAILVVNSLVVDDLSYFLSLKMKLVAVFRIPPSLMSLFLVELVGNDKHS